MLTCIFIYVIVNWIIIKPYIMFEICANCGSKYIGCGGVKDESSS